MFVSIIIVTDDVIFPSYFRTLLAKKLSDIHIVVSDSLNKISETLNNSRCRLILFDGNITKLSSFMVISHLRVDNKSKVPIWFFSEVQREEYNRRTLAIGATRIVKIPFDPYLICSEIVTLIENEI